MCDYKNAEYAVIGCLLIDDACFQPVHGVLPSSDAFASANCRKAYDTICTLAQQNKPVDPITVGHSAGLDMDFLQECMEIVPSCYGAAEYAETVQEGAKRRQLRDIGYKLQSDALAHDTIVAQLITDARSALDGIGHDVEGGNVHTPQDSFANFLRFREDVNDGKHQTIKSGLSGLDSILGGFAPGGLYIVAARPGVGKSALGIAMGDMLAKTNKVLYASLEMTEDEINARRVAAFSTAPCTYNRLLFGNTTASEDQAIAQACAKLAERDMYILEASRLTVAELGIKAQMVKADIIVVDYLGLLSGTNNKATEYERITEISGDLKRLAKQLHCVIIALCQLNRESTNNAKSDGLPKLSQIRSSGAIEQDADAALLLHRPEYSQTTTTRNPVSAQQFFVEIAKNRHGRTGTIELAWYAPVNRFEDRSGKWVDKSWT